VSKSLPIVTNKNNISLEMAVWVLHDEYDYIKEDRYISATGLMKPIRHIVLPGRVPEEQRVIPDVGDYIASALGTAIHAGVEKAWSHGNHTTALRRMGYPEEVIHRILVNPSESQLTSEPDAIPVYIEQRTIRDIVINGVTFKVGGKFDMVCEGRVTDTKSTTVYTWIYGGKDDDYRLQGSIYRWLNPTKITADFIRINFIFTDWNKTDAISRKGYPERRIMHKDILLMPMQETEDWIRNKLSKITEYYGYDEKQLPECTPEELWMSDPKFKYYADPVKALGGAGKSTKNFDNVLEAEAFKTEKGKGIVITIPGVPKRCSYCPAFPVCTQREQYNFE